jgi:uncharacterized protein YraI
MTLNSRRLLRIALPAVLLAVSAPAAFAMPAHIVATVHMRAGPSVEYPEVAMLISGTPLEVYGCEQAYAWCDVQAGPNRGWVDADYLQVDSGGHPVILSGAGVAIGVPLITFTFGTYWDSYYRTRPWYAQRARYLPYWRRYPHGRPPPPRRPPGARPPVRPPPHARPPPRPRPPAARPPGNRPPSGGDRPTPPPNGRPQPDNGGRPTPQA